MILITIISLRLNKILDSTKTYNPITSRKQIMISFLLLLFNTLITHEKDNGNEGFVFF